MNDLCKDIATENKSKRNKTKKQKTQNKDYRNGTNYVTDNQGSHAVTNDNKCLWNDLPNG